MITDGIPAVFFRSFGDSRPQGVQVDIGQTVHKRLALVHDNAFKAVTPEISSPVVPAIVIARKVDFDIPHKFRKAGQLHPEKRPLFFGEIVIFPIKAFTAFFYIVIAEIAFRQHFHQQVKMISHQAKAQNFGEIEFRKAFDQPQKKILFHISNGQTGQRRA